MDALEIDRPAAGGRLLSGPSLYRRLAVASLASIILVWMLLLGWFVWEVTREDVGYFDRDLVGLAENLSDVHRLELEPQARHAALERRVAQFSRAYADSALRDDEFAWQVTDRRGRVLERSPSWVDVPRLDVGGGPVGSDAWRTVVAEAVDGTVRVQVAVAQSFLQRARLEMLIFFLVPLVAVLPVLGLLLRLGIGRALRPLDKLTRALIRHVPQSTHPLECTDARYTELRPVFDSVNHLLARLAAYRENERRFVADAAHELRTPLAAIGAQVHLMVTAESAAERAKLAGMLHASIERSAALVGNLLTLSRLDAASSTGSDRQTVDVARLAREVVACHAPRAVLKDTSLAYEGPDSADLLGSAPALESALSNLVDNALRYCPRGASICVALHQEVDGLCVSVSDDGPGIAHDMREEVLKRFVRLPGAAPGGSGLGLAIVKRVAELHGGSVTLAGGPGGHGLTVSLCLPVSAACTQRPQAPHFDFAEIARARHA
jgi:signal transduction histidine kinase